MTIKIRATVQKAEYRRVMGDFSDIENQLLFSCGVIENNPFRFDISHLVVPGGWLTRAGDDHLSDILAEPRVPIRFCS
ncbi:MAG: hypothetical protein WCK53_03240 [Methanomicrobiales archaeon]